MDSARSQQTGELEQALAQELYMIVGRAMKSYGIRSARRNKALAQALRARRVPNASGRVRRQAQALGD